jgi:hypothetical protein
MTHVSQHPLPDLDAILDDTDRIEAALQQAVQSALRDHKRAGNSIAVWRDGQVVWLAPEDIPVPLEPVL